MHINLSGNDIGYAGAKAIATDLQENKTLSHIDLSYNKICEVGWLELSVLECFCPNLKIIGMLDDYRIKKPTSNVQQPKVQLHSITIDPKIADNQNEQTRNVVKKFKSLKKGVSDPEVRDYRLEVYSKVEETKNDIKFIQTQQYSPFKKEGMVVDSLESFTEIKANLKSKNVNYHGICELTLSDVPAPLPSLFPHEILECIYVEGIDAKQLNFNYCSERNQYFLSIVNLGNVNVVVKFILSNSKPTEFQGKLPKIILGLIDKYKKAKIANEDISSDFTTKQIIEELIKTPQGSCRHRSMTFMTEFERLKKEGKIPNTWQVRTIINDIHQFIEICDNGGLWQRVDLGGYPIPNLQVDNDLLTKESKTQTPDKSGRSKSPEIKPQKIKVEKPPTQSGGYLQESKKYEKSVQSETIKSLPPNYGERIETKNSLFDKINKTPQTNILLNLGQNDIEQSFLYLFKLAYANNIPIYYINTPEEMAIYQSLLIEEEKGELVGLIVPLSHHPLHKFLTDPEFKCGWIIINWANFSFDKFVTCHNVFDEKRQISGIALPNDMKVISLLPIDKPECYTGNDFIDRHHVKLDCSDVSFEQKAEKIFPFTEDKESDITIQLNHSPNWKSRLIGRWQPCGDRMVFKEGALLKALRADGKGKHFVLHNAPWDLQEFRLFWQKLKINKTLEYSGQTITLPDGVSFDFKEGYDRPKLNGKIDSCTYIKKNQTLFPNVHILNPMCFYAFFHNTI